MQYTYCTTYYTAPIPHHSCGRAPIFIHPYLPTTDLVYLADPSLSPKNPLIYCTNTSQKMVTNHTILILHSLYVRMYCTTAATEDLTTYVC